MFSSLKRNEQYRIQQFLRRLMSKANYSYVLPQHVCKSRQRQILGPAPSHHVALAAWLQPNRASLLKPGRLAAEVRVRWSCLLWKTSMRFLYEQFGLDRVPCCVSWLVFFCICFDQLHMVVEALFLPVWLDLACQLHLVLLFSYFVDLITSCCSHLP